MSRKKVAFLLVALFALALAAGCVGKRRAVTEGSVPRSAALSTSTPIPYVPRRQEEEPTPTPSPSPTARMASFATPEPTSTKGVIGLVIPLKAALYGKPGGPKAVGALRGGETVRILGRDSSGAWLLVSGENGEKGWTREREIDVLGDLSSVPAVAKAPASSGRYRVRRPTPQGAIFYTADSGIYRLDVASGKVGFVTGGIEPAVSPTGRWLAFVRGGGEKGLWVRDLDSGKERRVFGGFDIRTPRWAPDESSIYFSVQDETRPAQHRCIPFIGRCWDIPEDKRWHIAEVSFPGGRYTGIPSDFHSFAPNPMPHGKVLYQNERGLAVTKLDSAPSQVLDKPWVLSPWVSPRGGIVAVQYRLHQEWVMALVGADGSGFSIVTRPDPLSEKKQDFVSPVWSPDGRFLALLHRDEGGSWEILITDIEGKAVRRLHPSPPPTYLFDGAQTLSWGR